MCDGGQRLTCETYRGTARRCYANRPNTWMHPTGVHDAAGASRSAGAVHTCRKGRIIALLRWCRAVYRTTSLCPSQHRGYWSGRTWPFAARQAGFFVRALACAVLLPEQRTVVQNPGGTRSSSEGRRCTIDGVRNEGAIVAWVKSLFASGKVIWSIPTSVRDER